MPEAVYTEATRTFLNWLGCAVGGATHPAIDIAWAASKPFAGAAQASILGRDIRTDALGQTTHQLLNNYFRSLPETPDPDYMQTLSEFMVLLVMNIEKVRPILEFSDWYNEQLRQRGITLK